MSNIYTGAMVNMVLIPMNDEVLTAEEKVTAQFKCMQIIGAAADERQPIGECFIYLTRDGKSIEVKVKWMYSFSNH